MRDKNKVAGQSIEVIGIVGGSHLNVRKIFFD
jgi:hypothetical protein